MIGNAIERWRRKTDSGEIYLEQSGVRGRGVIIWLNPEEIIEFADKLKSFGITRRAGNPRAGCCQILVASTTRRVPATNHAARPSRLPSQSGGRGIDRNFTPR